MFFVKKTSAVILGSVAASLLAVSFSSQAVDASSAQITVTAKVLNNTCSAGWGTTNTIALGNISAADAGAVASGGAVGTAKTITLNLTACDSSLKTVHVTASGTPDSSKPDYFAATGSGAANLAVAFWGGPTTSTLMKPTAGTPVDYPIASGKADLTFKAQLIHTNTTALTAGDVSSVINLAMDYE